LAGAHRVILLDSSAQLAQGERDIGCMIYPHHDDDAVHLIG